MTNIIEVTLLSFQADITKYISLDQIFYLNQKNSIISILKLKRNGIQFIFHIFYYDCFENFNITYFSDHFPKETQFLGIFSEYLDNIDRFSLANEFKETLSILFKTIFIHQRNIPLLFMLFTKYQPKILLLQDVAKELSLHQILNQYWFVIINKSISTILDLSYKWFHYHSNNKNETLLHKIQEDFQYNFVESSFQEQFFSSSFLSPINEHLDNLFLCLVWNKQLILIDNMIKLCSKKQLISLINYHNRFGLNSFIAAILIGCAHLVQIFYSYLSYPLLDIHLLYDSLCFAVNSNYISFFNDLSSTVLFNLFQMSSPHFKKQGHEIEENNDEIENEIDQKKSNINNLNEITQNHFIDPNFITLVIENNYSELLDLFLQRFTYHNNLIHFQIVIEHDNFNIFSKIFSTVSLNDPDFNFILLNCYWYCCYYNSYNILSNILIKYNIGQLLKLELNEKLNFEGISGICLAIVHSSSRILPLILSPLIETHHLHFSHFIQQNHLFNNLFPFSSDLSLEQHNIQIIYQHFIPTFPLLLELSCYYSSMETISFLISYFKDETLTQMVVSILYFEKIYRCFNQSLSRLTRLNSILKYVNQISAISFHSHDQSSFIELLLGPLTFPSNLYEFLPERIIQKISYSSNSIDTEFLNQILPHLISMDTSFFLSLITSNFTPYLNIPTIYISFKKALLQTINIYISVHNNLSIYFSVNTSSIILQYIGFQFDDEKKVQNFFTEQEQKKFNV